MSKENKTSDKLQNGNDFITDVMPRLLNADFHRFKQIQMRKTQDKFQPWYTENEIRHFLKRNKYSDHIADELTPLWTKLLNSAYRKGLEHGQRNYNPVNVPPKQGEKLPMHNVSDTLCDYCQGTKYDPYEYGAGIHVPCPRCC